MKSKYELTSEYIQSAWKSAIKSGNGVFSLPFDYVPPCINGELTDLYYWDTYFTNLGLFCDGFGEYALGNIENLKFCLRKFGCVPNICRANGAEVASQPPLLSLMIAYAYEQTHDNAALRSGYEALLCEYDFWMNERLAPNGLNRYGTNCKNEAQLVSIADWYAARVKKDIASLTRSEKVCLAQNSIAEGESGEDHTRRFGGIAMQVNPVDLNCYMYLFEQNMAFFCGILRISDKTLWLERAQSRLQKIREYCYDQSTGVYYDYNFVTKERTGIICAACYLPYVAGISSDVTALDKINRKLIYPYGAVSCEYFPPNGETYQWGYPNTWAPHNYYAYLANIRVGNTETAEKIRKNFLSVVADCFVKEKKLYEKYDAVSGGKATVDEYGTPEMLGWTAGVFQYFYKICKEKTENGF